MRISDWSSDVCSSDLRARIDIALHADGWSVTRALDRWRRAMGRPIYFVDFAADTARIAHDPGIRLAEAAYWLRFEALASRAVPLAGLLTGGRCPAAMLG